MPDSTRRRGRWVATVVVALAAAGLTPRAQSPPPDTAPTRFAEEIRAFHTLDARNTPPPRAVLFVGSSTIRLWPTADRFPRLTVLNRGFGGAMAADVNHYVEQTVLKYAPSVVVFYAGDNDVALGKSPDDITRDYRTFAERVTGALPQAHIIFIAIKPSVARWHLWPTMRDVNDRVRTYAASHPRLHFADVAPPMLGADGRPQPRLFVEDGLHMTEAGYDIWTDVVGRVLAGLPK